MARPEFTDGMRRLLRSHPALPPERTRELAAQFNRAQEDVCRHLAALSYPLERVSRELKDGRLPYFREGSDQDRKRNLGRKSSYRFAGFTPSHGEEYDRRLAESREGRLGVPEFEAWQARFLMGFTFDVIELVGQRALPAGPEAPGAEALESAVSQARVVRDEILLGNLLLVAKLAMRRGAHLAGAVPDELFTAGTDGLHIAISRFDPSVGQFSTYATPWIAMAIDRFVARTRSVIRIPIGMQDKARRQSIQLPEVQSLEEPIPGFQEGDLRLEDVVADPLAAEPRQDLERADIASILLERMQGMDTLRQFVLAMRTDVGDALALAARLFREEADLSLARGRGTAAAAFASSDQPARIRMIGGTNGPAEMPAAALPVALELAG